jgi:hypothetical protein
MSDEARAAKARELAAWFREVAGGDGGGLMARTAAALERAARTQRTQDVARGRAANDNSRSWLRRRKP